MTCRSLVVYRAKVPAPLPLVGMPVAQALNAIGVDGLTVEALGAPAASPGNRVTKPPLAVGWTIVTWASTPLRSLGKLRLPKRSPANRNRRVLPAVRVPGVIGEP